ncbi:MAG: cupin domain-containing protein [Pseudomonadota bacterium]
MRYRNITLTLLLAAAPLGADDDRVVPEAEYDQARQDQRAGPGETHGIRHVRALGSVPLDRDFDALRGHELRAREIVIEPGGQVAVHEHDARPGVAYILEGTLTEYRGPDNRPLVRGVGAVSFEQTGVVHWWRNETAAPARALVVDIVPVAAE